MNIFDNVVVGTEINQRCQRCQRCGGEAKLFQHVFRNGKRHVTLRCSRCNANCDPLHRPFVPIPPGVNVETLPVLYDDRSAEYSCERCGAIGAELHHWAPKVVFGKDEANDWPKSWLCPACHEEWASKIAHYFQQFYSRKRS